MAVPASRTDDTNLAGTSRRLSAVSAIGRAVIAIVVIGAGVGLGLADWEARQTAQTSQPNDAALAGEARTDSTQDDGTQNASTQNADTQDDSTQDDNASASLDTPVQNPAQDPPPAKPISQSRLDAISTRAFVDATLSIGEAVNAVPRGAQPNLNPLQSDDLALDGSAPNGSAPNGSAPSGIGTLGSPPQVDEYFELAFTDPAIAADNKALREGASPIEGATGLLTLLVRFPNRLDLDIKQTWATHHEQLLVPALEQIGACPADDCTQRLAHLTPSFDPPANGEYERVAAQRTAGTGISPDTYLTAAFELALWRPIELHPAAGDIYRHVAADVRLTTANAGAACDISALWLAAAVESEMRVTGAINFGIIYFATGPNAGRKIDLPSVARYVARKGCTAESAAVFWSADGIGDGSAVGSVSAANGGRARGERARGGRSTDGSSADSRAAEAAATSPAVNARLTSWRTYDPELIGSHRACDIVERIVPREQTVVVRGFQVHPCLEESFSALLNAARSDGVYLRGGAWRSTHQQVRLRMANCSLPSRRAADYRVELSLAPSSICNPETAPPGRSRHEAGLAVDFACGANNQTIGRGRCYRWAARNASQFGFFNHTSEPWHWSIDGR